MRKARYDLKQVICKNSSCIGHSSNVAWPGCWIVTRDGRTGRVLGRVAETEGFPDCTGYLATVFLHFRSAEVAWISPVQVALCYERPPAQLLAWITGDNWVKSKEDIAHVIAMGEHGTLQEQFIATRDQPDQTYNARPEYVAQFILKS